ISSGGVRVVDDWAVERYGVTDSQLAAVAAAEEHELARRERLYRGSRPPPALAGRTVILVDDGLATGATMTAAVHAVRAQRPHRIVVAVPVGARDSCTGIARLADEMVCLMTPEPFEAVSLWYEDFTPTEDEEVRALLGTSAAREEEVRVDADGVTLDATLRVPHGARGMVLFAHGSGSSRQSPRNRHVAQVLHDGGFATLLLDLLTPREESVDSRTGELRFDIPLLARRLAGAMDWLAADAALGALPVGLFGASTGGGAALVAAAERPGHVRAVVSRGGRPDLAGEALPRVDAPTLLIVGGRDEEVLALNRAAERRMRGTVRVAVVPGATHLFEEPGTLDEVARLARDWFAQHLHA
ncbi:MAG TPA: alpha/beta family hydrolase, partial [Gemmatimonadales bacterium]|nr:alpha/beta family hydrolase [Gemmatimonadales bacterium]